MRLFDRGAGSLRAQLVIGQTIHRSALVAHSSISTGRCNAYAASDAECCSEDTPVSSLSNVSRSRLTARPAVVFVALRLMLSKPSPRRTCLLSPGVAGYFGWFGNSRGELKWSRHRVETLFYRQPWPGPRLAWTKPGNSRTGDNPEDSRSGYGLLPVHDRRCGLHRVFEQSCAIWPKLASTSCLITDCRQDVDLRLPLPLAWLGKSPATKRRGKDAQVRSMSKEI
jgi:hypothetical protein